MMRIGFPLFPGFTGLDLMGPHEVLSRCEADCLLVAEDELPVSSNQGIAVVPHTSFAACPPLDLLVVPGGPGQTPAMTNRALIEFIADAARQADQVSAVCTGVLLLGPAGLLQGRRATTHWLAMGELLAFGAIPVRERVVADGNLVTGAGVSAGVDLALHLVAKLFGPQKAQEIQLAIEYDPDPPFACGHPDVAPPELVEKLRSTSRFHKK